MHSCGSLIFRYTRKSSWKWGGVPSILTIKPPESLCCYLLTYSMEKSPCLEANWFSASQEITHMLWNPKVHYLNHRCPPTVPILSQIDPVQALTSHFLNIYLNIILPFASGFFKGSLPLRFPHQNPVYTSALTHTCYMPRPSHYSRFHHPNNNGCGNLYVAEAWIIFII
jgi:hypothetical protein